MTGSSRHCAVSPDCILLRHSSMSVFASVSVVNIPRLSSSSFGFPLNDSMYPFSQGLLDSMESLVTLRPFNHLRTAFVVNSGSLSERIYSILWLEASGCFHRLFSRNRRSFLRRIQKTETNHCQAFHRRRGHIT